MNPAELARLARRYNALWNGVALVVVGLVVWDAGGFIWNSRSPVYVSTSTYVALVKFPGIYLHGVILGVLALALFAGVFARRPRAPLAVLAIYLGFTTSQYFSAWWSTGVVLWQAPSKPLAACVLCIVLAFFAPHREKGRDVAR